MLCGKEITWHNYTLLIINMYHLISWERMETMERHQVILKLDISFTDLCHY